MNTTQPTILLAEDDDNDIFFMLRALRKAEIDLPFQVVTNGQEALDYLGGAGKFAAREDYPLPALMLLDLKMPFIDGFDVLAWLRSNPALNSLPVVVLTSSPEERDRRKAAELGARAYFIKPPTAESVKEMLNFLAPCVERLAAPV